MTAQKLEEMFIRSLDVPMTEEEQKQLHQGLEQEPSLRNQLEEHRAIRVLLRRSEPANFGPYFASKLISKIQNTGVVIDRQLFRFFRKFQLAAIGVVVALLIANIIYSEQQSLISILGIERTNSADEEIISFDYTQSLTK